MSRRLIARGCAMCLAMLAGCGEGPQFERGQAAERRGEPQIAYAHYLSAASEHPGGATAQALERLRPSAAAYWERKALMALDDGKHADAWRMLMMALEIQPDDGNLVQMIRKIEAQAPGEVAPVKLAYLERGSPALRIVSPAPTALAQAPTPAPEEASGQPPRLAPRPPTRLSELERGENGDYVAGLGSPPAGVRSPMNGAGQETPEVRSTLPPAAQVRPRAAKKSLRASPSPPRPAGGNQGEFTLIVTLSLRDRRYDSRVDVVDGIRALLRDTEDDPEADLDLYLGNRRIKKLRDMEIGQSQTFAGASGALYRVTILSIHHKSRTVRLGFRPA